MLYRPLSEFLYASSLRILLGIEYWFWYPHKGKIEFATGESNREELLQGINVAGSTRIGVGSLTFLYRNLVGTSYTTTLTYILQDVYQQKGWLDALQVRH